MEFKILVQIVIASILIVVGIGMLFPLIWHRKIRATCTFCTKNEHPYLRVGRRWRRQPYSGYQSDFEYYQDGEYYNVKQRALYDAKHTPGKEYTIFISKNNTAMTVSEVVRASGFIVLGIIIFFV